MTVYLCRPGEDVIGAGGPIVVAWILCCNLHPVYPKGATSVDRGDGCTCVYVRVCAHVCLWVLCCGVCCVFVSLGCVCVRVLCVIFLKA